MSIADVGINLVNWIFQKMILPVLPVDLPLISYETFYNTLHGSLEHNLTYAFAGLTELFNLKLLFILLLSILTMEVLFWLVKAGFFFVKLIRG